MRRSRAVARLLSRDRVTSPLAVEADRLPRSLRCGRERGLGTEPERGSGERTVEHATAEFPWSGGLIHGRGVSADG